MDIYMLFAIYLEYKSCTKESSTEYYNNPIINKNKIADVN